jgi:hypothetical protein
VPFASDAAAFRGPAAIVRNGSDVANRGNLKPYSRESTNGGLTSGSRAFHEYFHAAQTEIVGFFASSRSGYLGSVRSVLTAAFETHLTRTGPGNRVPVLIRERDLHVVERSFDVCLSIGLDNYALLTYASSAPFYFSQGVLGWLNCPAGVAGNACLLTRCGFFAGHGFLLALAGTCVGLGTLTADREAATVTQTTVATDIHQSLDVQLDLGAQLAFHQVLILDELTDGLGLVFRPGIGPLVGIDVESGKDLNGAGTANSKDGSEGDFAALFDVQVLSCNSWHRSSSNAWNKELPLSLTLFVFRVFLVDHVDAAFPADNLVLGAAFFDTGTHFHVSRGLFGARRSENPFLVVADLLRRDPHWVRDSFVKLICSGIQFAPWTSRKETVLPLRDLPAGF